MIQSALIVTRPRIDLLLSGEKRVELRAMTSTKREVIGLIAKGTKTIVGVVRIADCHGPLTVAQLNELRHMHLVPAEYLEKEPRWRWAWWMEEPRSLARPVPYPHKSGAQTFVVVAAGVALRVEEQLG